MSAKTKELTCGFCGSRSSDAPGLIAGRNAHICSRCVDRALEALDGPNPVVEHFTRAETGTASVCMLCSERSDETVNVANRRSVCRACLELCRDIRTSESRIRAGKPIV